MIKLRLAGLQRTVFCLVIRPFSGGPLPLLHTSGVRMAARKRGSMVALGRSVFMPTDPPRNSSGSHVPRVFVTGVAPWDTSQPTLSEAAAQEGTQAWVWGQRGRHAAGSTFPLEDRHCHVSQGSVVIANTVQVGKVLLCTQQASVGSVSLQKARAPAF